VTAILVTLTVLCAPLAAACMCRLYKLNPANDKFGWGVMYLAMLIGVLCVLAEAKERQGWPPLGEFAFLAAVALNIILTHQQWRFNNSPMIVKKTS
jgi:predicted membrane channel-forming protein YqfA (hemolysin III family)